MIRLPMMKPFPVFGLFILLSSSLLRAGSLTEDRKYQPVVIKANASYSGDGANVSLFRGFLNTSVGDLYLYRYGSSDGTWSMMPYQIDERTRGPDPVKGGDSSWFYIILPDWSVREHDGRFNGLDELVFLIGDMGDRAPADAWIDDAESRAHGRLELTVQDSLDPDKKAYAYLYRSATITEPVPAPYDFAYDPETDRIDTRYYFLKHDRHGVIEDIGIKPPGGDGRDLLDVLKLRFSGVIDAFQPLDIILTENNFDLFPDEVYTSPRPVVRLIRQAKQAVRIFTILLEDTPFWLRTHYYPFSGTIETGASIYKEDLDAMFPDADITIVMRYARQSWDFNENARGMRFFNPYNRDIPVDGMRDDVDLTVDVPVNAWSLLTGDPGSVFTLMQLTEQNWDQVRLYYHDSASGGQADSAQFGVYDTGDGRSFGDHGIWLRNIGRDSLTFDLNLTTYFIPEKNLDWLDVGRIRDMALNPLAISSAVQPFVETGVSAREGEIREFRLEQNTPNPFNGSTEIPFALTRASAVRLVILDIRGRTIRTLISGRLDAGAHRAVWDGRDDRSGPVSSGIYLCRLDTDEGVRTRKLILTQ